VCGQLEVAALETELRLGHELTDNPLDSLGQGGQAQELGNALLAVILLSVLLHEGEQSLALGLVDVSELELALVGVDVSVDVRVRAIQESQGGNAAWVTSGHLECN